MIQQLSLPEWHRMAQEGVVLPMRIQVNGNSMFPLLRSQRDYVTIYPLDGLPQRGDVILFADPRRDARYLLHRAWQTDGGTVLPWGDNCAAPDGTISLSNVWGKAVLVERGKRKIKLDPVKGLRLAKVWHKAGRFWRLGLRIKRKIGRIMRGPHRR